MVSFDTTIVLLALRHFQTHCKKCRVLPPSVPVQSTSQTADPPFNPVIEPPSEDDMQSIYHTPGSAYLDLPDTESLGDRQSIPDTIVCTKFHAMDVFLRLFLDGGLR